MVSIDDIRKAAIAEKIESKDINIKCALIIDVIFDKTLYLVSVDKKKSWIEKKLVVDGAKSLKDPVKEFLINEMSTEDAKDVMNKIRRISCDGEQKSI